MPIAFITGITGQDGSYLAELLLDKGYEVHGLVRRSSSFNTSRIDHIFEHKQLHLHHGDVTDGPALARLIADVRPSEIYNLAAQSHVAVSFECANFTCDVDALGFLNVLEAVRAAGLIKTCRIYQASTSEMFGGKTPVQSETTPFDPQSPYACAKVMAYNLGRLYRKSYGMFVSNGILFNHESPRRGMTFVTQKIAKGVVDIVHGKLACLTLGNLDAKRDWGDARDYVNAMWKILQHDKPIDLVIATGETHTVREFIEHAFKEVGLSIKWSKPIKGSLDTDPIEIGTDQKNVVRVKSIPKYFRPSEVDVLLGDARLAARTIGWTATTKFNTLVADMVRFYLDNTA